MKCFLNVITARDKFFAVQQLQKKQDTVLIMTKCQMSRRLSPNNNFIMTGKFDQIDVGPRKASTIRQNNTTREPNKYQ